MDKLLYGPDGRLLYKNGTLVTDAFGAPCCGCGGSECNPASLVFGPCEYPCNNAAGYQWAFQSSPGVYTEPTPTAVPSCQRCCDIFKDVPNGWTTTEQQFFVDRSAQGDIYYFSSRSEIVRRYSSHPHTLYVSIAEFLTECRRSSGCVSINSFNAQTTFPPANPEPGLYCTIGYAGAPINSWGPELPNYVCGPPNTGYTCAANGSFDCQTGSTRHVVAQDSGTSYIAFGRSNTLRLYAGCNGTSSCCCAGTCYGNVVSGCPGPVFYPGQSNCAGVPCFVRPPTGACCVQGSCLGHLLASECAALSGSFHLGRDCRNVLCGIAIGSCCLPDGSCANTPESECLSIGGIWNGPGTTCAATICPVIPTGACCTPIGCVGGLTQSQCLAQGGTGWFQGQACTPTICGGAGVAACCFPDGTCQLLTCQDCTAQGGTCTNFLTCSQAGCGFGACCRNTSHGPVCTIETRAQCVGEGATFLGEGTSCTPDPCGTIATNPFNPFTPQQVSRIVVPGSGCSGCGGAGARVL